MTIRASAVALLALAGSLAHAQTCDLTWLPGGPGRTVGGTVNALTNFDPDGPGPTPFLLVAGGEGVTVGGYGAEKVMAFDGDHWAPIGATGGGGAVNALAVWNSQLIAAGAFSSIGGVTATNVAVWNGTAWAQMGISGLSGGDVRALAVYQGDLYAGGTFTAGAGPLFRIARWTGTFWTNVGGGMVGGTTQINAMCVQNSELFAGGNFTTAGSTAATNLASWNGTAWTARGNPDNTVYALAPWSSGTTPHTRVFIGGLFNNIGGMAASKCASMNRDTFGTITWSAFSPGGIALASACHALHIRSSGPNGFQVNAVWSQTNPFGPNPQNVFRWVPASSSWTQLGSTGDARCLGNNAGMVGGFSTGFPSSVMQWDNTNWVAFGGGAPGPIHAMVAAGGEAVAAVDDPADLSPWAVTVQRRSASTGDWTVLGAADGAIHAVAVMPNGDVLAAGSFTNIGGVAANRVAVWNGAAWAPLGSGIGGAGANVFAVGVLPNGDVVAGGQFTTAGGLGVTNIARWNGFAWSAMSSGISGTVQSIEVAQNGDVYVGGQFQNASGALVNNITRWNGANWLPLGAGTNGGVLAIEQMPDGAFVVGGVFTTAGGAQAINVARWNGSAWSAMGDGLWQGGIYDLQNVNGEVVASGQFQSSGGQNVRGIARWDGASWQPFGEGLTGGPTNSIARAIAVLGDGSLAAGGDFTHADGDVSAWFAVWGLPAGCCDDIDFNNDGLFPDNFDLTDFLSVFGGGNCSGQPAGAPPCNTDIDFNNDGLFPDNADIFALFAVFGGAGC
ncbi:MAG TPA: hypothetical protein VD971_14160 [Phycisphaerales bacterium]|nr:hypothetical protein [Phycisphaerales bacterium]